MPRKKCNWIEFKGPPSKIIGQLEIDRVEWRSKRAMIEPDASLAGSLAPFSPKRKIFLFLVERREDTKKSPTPISCPLQSYGVRYSHYPIVLMSRMN